MLNNRLREHRRTFYKYAVLARSGNAAPPSPLFGPAGKCHLHVHLRTALAWPGSVRSPFGSGAGCAALMQGHSGAVSVEVHGLGARHTPSVRTFRVNWSRSCKLLCEDLERCGRECLVPCLRRRRQTETHVRTQSQ